jgi:hypothetical protein
MPDVLYIPSMKTSLLLPIALCLLVPAGMAYRGCGTSDRRLPQKEEMTSRPTPLSPGFQRGVNYAHVHSRGHGYGSQSSAYELDTLRRLGIGWIAVTPFGYQPGAAADAIVGFPEDESDIAHRRGDRSLTDSDLVAEAAAAHRLGIRITLKPHLWSRDFWDGGAWQGTINQNSPEEHVRWWRSYRAFALHYARVAEQGGFDLYCIGTELVEITTRHPDEWRALIADIRRVYHGKLSYAAHWDRELDGITFWDALDYIGVTAYFPLDVSDSATVDELVRAWEPHRRRIEALATRYGKSVLFLEAGYRPATGAYRQPWADRGGAFDPEIQARAYEALFRAFSDAPWWSGVYFWKVFTDPRRAGYYGEDMGFSFRGLPAETVVAAWFRAGEGPRRSDGG